MSAVCCKNWTLLATRQHLCVPTWLCCWLIVTSGWQPKPAPGSAIWHDGALLVSWPARLYVSFLADWQQAVAQRCCCAMKCMTGWAQAGACFGLSAAACRTGFLLAARTSWLAAPAGLGASIAFTSAGFMLQVRPCLHPTL